MADEQSIVVIPADSSEVARVELRLSWNEYCSWGRHRLLKRSQGWLPLGNGEPLWLGGRIMQGALKFKLFQQVSKEIKELRAKGKIADEFAEKK